MSGKRIQLKRGTTAQNSTFTGLDGEVTVDTTKKTLVVHDGTTVGGTVLAKDSDVALKVDKVVGKQLSTEDYTTAEKSKLAGIAASANNYTHPASGVGAGTYRSVTVDANGHVTAGTNPTTVSGYGLTDAYTKTEVNTSLALKVNNSEKGVANGVATLDGNGKVVLTQIPDSVLGQLEYMGTWNFTTMPTATQKGQYWIANTSGNGYVVGDWAVWNGSAFDKVDNTDAVASVAGRTGNVVLTKSDVGLSNVDNIADSAKNVLSATKWTTARTLSLAGDVTGSASIDGSGNVTINATVVDDSHSHIIADVDGLQTALDNKVAKVVSTDNALPKFNGTTGDIQNSGVIIDDSNNVGLGAAPSSWHSTLKSISFNNSAIAGDSGSTSLTHNGYYYTSASWKYKSTGSPVGQFLVNGDTLKFRTAPTGTAGNAVTFTTKFNLDSAGNFALGGATPKVWRTDYKAIEVNNASISGDASAVQIAYNGYISTDGWRYNNSGLAGNMLINDAGIKWRLASSGIADATITWNEAMTLSDSGSLSVPAGITANLTGNSSTASTLQTARTINGVSFNGSANIVVADSTKLPLSGGTLTGLLGVAVTGAQSANISISADANYWKYLRLKTTGEVIKWDIATKEDDLSGALQFRAGGGSTTASLSTSGVLTASSFVGSLSGNASTATNVAWSGITSKPTTLSGYGITDAALATGVVAYNGTTAAAGKFDGGTTTPTGTTRLNYGGFFYPTTVNLVGTNDTAAASSHVFVETASDGFVRPKTLANFKTEIFASPALVTPNIGVATGTSFNSITELSAVVGTANGTAAVGTSTAVARADHVHPSDTTKVAKVTSTDNAIVRFNGVTGDVQNSGVVVDDSNNVGIGSVPGVYAGYRTLTIRGVDSSHGGVLELVSSDTSSHVQIFNTADRFNIGTVTNHPIVFNTANTERLRIEANGNLLLTSATGALGYGTGSGGLVTQLTNKSTNVTLNKPSGRIFMHSATLGIGASVSFIVNNSVFGTLDTVILTGKAWSGLYQIENANSATGGFGIRVTNVSGTSRSDPIEINFTILKGAEA